MDWPGGEGSNPPGATSCVGNVIQRKTLASNGLVGGRIGVPGSVGLWTETEF
ncbi:hypothetical protein L195_g062887 [Trifolium pratense]|uniref:Uncharacterized protein n=1 Tax=Trifolium pratense TaxID=57577 RepID=A0A2K3KIG2_TRIPR|nr:hypothetical protein L195_g062887 [Trifolium pratense]